jgi:hypothetical protein
MKPAGMIAGNTVDGKDMARNFLRPVMLQAFFFTSWDTKGLFAHPDAPHGCAGSRRAAGGPQAAAANASS